MMHRRAMEIGCPIVFTHAYHHHLDQSAADSATKIIGVRFHAVQYHNAISRESCTAGKGGDSILGTTNFAGLHRGLNGYPHGLLSNTVIGKNPFLPFWRSPTVAAHGRHNKGLHPGRLQFTQYREHDLLDIGNPTASHCESHPRTGGKTVLNQRDLFSHRIRDLQGRRLGKPLTHRQHSRQGTGIK